MINGLHLLFFVVGVVFGVLAGIRLEKERAREVLER